VGNIIAGGSGKTPFVEKIGKDLSSLAALAILSRGYRSKKHKGEDAFSYEVYGDEPSLLAKTLPEAQLFIGKNRHLSAKRAAEKGAELIILDDGMQYLSLHRDLEIIVLHAEDLYGKGFYLPRGYLRDSPERLKKADAIILSHVKNKKHFEELRSKVRSYSEAPLIGTHMAARYVVEGGGNRRKSLEGVKVGVFCGLGKPHSFFETVKEFGGNIVDTLLLPDHVAPSKKELESFVARCKERRCDMILCSKKDWIKCPQELFYTLPIGYLEAELEVTYGKENYEALLKRIAQIVKKRELS
ncbi:MAG: tetraacyldisaccharide 4'-kinase, partial [Simkania negevensis]|nr:tetraacyldisaccharide 4'-kinase [Simkania negevensis]